MNVQELYEQTIKTLPTAQRLRLAALILNDLAPSSEVDDSDSWTEDDLQDFTQMSWQSVDQHLESEEDA
jgi:protoheme ferro-lyase